MNDYQHMMEHIRPPECLNDRVLTAVRQQERPVPRARECQPIWRTAVCAVLALALVAGGISLRSRVSEDPETIYYTEVLEIPEMYFGIPAHAAGLGANGAVLLEQVEGRTAEELDGTVQNLVITFADGAEATGTYLLRREDMRAFTNEDGSKVFVPALEGETAETVSGIYAVPAEESRWLQWPVAGSNTVSLSAPYGKYLLVLTSDPPAGQSTFVHTGIDIPAQQGTDITAALSGTVTETGFDADRGNYLVLDHGGGLTTLYGQCQEVLVEEGDTVEAGDEIALLGSTGKSTGPHLHFEVRQDGQAQNPVAYFDRDIRDTLKMG